MSELCLCNVSGLPQHSVLYEGYVDALESQAGLTDAAPVCSRGRIGQRGPGRRLHGGQARGLGVPQRRTGADTDGVCDQIVPADDFPSASQAGVLNYIDRQLVRHYRRHRDAYRQGLAEYEQSAANASAQISRRLPQCSNLQLSPRSEQQDRAFFELVRDHTLEGYYGSPRHGGNRDAVSWRMLGLAEPPPFAAARNTT